ncbi:MAG: hypothetical protein K6F27_11560 [Ruminococcus sp.]|nr:hypothetical protein [Ruminococcus sp.]
MDFYGFRYDETEFSKVEEVIAQAKKEIKTEAQRLYNNLLAREIENLTDDIILGAHENDRIVCIYDAAIEILNRKIAVAIANGFDTEFNFGAALNIFSYNNRTYIQLATHMFQFYEILKSIPNLIDLSILSTNDEKSNAERTEIWQSIIKKYGENACIKITAFPTANVPFEKPDFNELHFETPISRATTRARYRLTNHFLTQYAGGGEIPPHKLMEYLDSALLKVSEHNSKDILEQFKIELLNYLPVIHEKYVMAKMTDQISPKQQVEDILRLKNEEINDITDGENTVEVQEDTVNSTAENVGIASDNETVVTEGTTKNTEKITAEIHQDNDTETAQDIIESIFNDESDKSVQTNSETSSVPNEIDLTKLANQSLKNLEANS